VFKSLRAGFFLFQKIKETESRFTSLFNTSEVEPDSEAGGSGSATGGFRQDYGWYYVLDQLARDTPNTMIEDILEWNLEYFLYRIQYLKHKGEVELFEMKYGRS
jgi:peptidoglycan/xylan/chitin deacetylase (PgdA/CDA1 family)